MRRMGWSCGGGEGLAKGNVSPSKVQTIGAINSLIWIEGAATDATETGCSAGCGWLAQHRAGAVNAGPPELHSMQCAAGMAV